MAWPVFIVNTQDYQCFFLFFFYPAPILGTNAGHCNDISSRCCHQQWLCGASRWSCQLVWVVVFREWIRQDPVWCIIVLTSPASLLKKANRQASINDRDHPGVRTRLFKQNLVSNLFKSGLFQFTGWESHIFGPSAPWCLVSLLKILHCGLLKDSKCLWGRHVCGQFVERWDYLALEKQTNLPCVVVALAGGSIL